MSKLSKLICALGISAIALSANAGMSYDNKRVNSMLYEAYKSIDAANRYSTEKSCQTHLLGALKSTNKAMSNIQSGVSDKAIQNIGKADFELSSLNAEGKTCLKEVSLTLKAKSLLQAALYQITQNLFKFTASN